MVTSRDSRIRPLDGLRGLSCLLVLLGHTQGMDGMTILPPFVIAMDLFFALSGYLISSILLAELEATGTIVLRRFWIRRMFRLLPAFYVFFGLGALAYAVTGFHPIIGESPYLSFLSTGLYASNWPVAFGHKLGIYTITWSLSLEEQFYLVCPLLFLGSYRALGKPKTAVLFGILVLVVIAWRIYVFDQTLSRQGVQAAWDRCYSGLDTRMDSLLIGGVAALVRSTYGDRLRIGPRTGMAAFGLILSMLFIRDIPLVHGIQELSWHIRFMIGGGFNLVALLCALTILHVVQWKDSLVSRALSNRVLVTIGIFSYSVYLWHTAIFGGLEIVLKDMNGTPPLWLAKTALKFLTLAAIANLSYRFVEKPFLLRHRATN
jgi:peptidoglycan/LPS O-acetylase OafA/YrhL